MTREEGGTLRVLTETDTERIHIESGTRPLKGIEDKWMTGKFKCTITEEEGNRESLSFSSLMSAFTLSVLTLILFFLLTL